jgi:hypothetical protein
MYVTTADVMRSIKKSNKSFIELKDDPAWVDKIQKEPDRTVTVSIDPNEKVKEVK